MISSVSNGLFFSWHFWKELIVKIWMVSKFIVIPPFTIKCDKKTLHILFRDFWWKFFTKCRKQRESNKFSNNCYDLWLKFFCNVWRLLKIETEFITKQDKFFKVWHVLKCVTIITKWDMTQIDVHFFFDSYYRDLKWKAVHLKTIKILLEVIF